MNSEPRSDPSRSAPSQTTATHPPLVRALQGEALPVPPVWLMRQAGRYLPEYRQVRAQAGGFLDLCMAPKLATEVTLQPIRRYALDAAILFSDILVVPHGLGQKLWFEEGAGPKLAPVDTDAPLAGLSADGLHGRLAPVYETVERIRGALPAEVALIGFAGAPWTVATYMVEGGTSRAFGRIKSWMYRDPQAFGGLMDLLVESTSSYLLRQVEAGAQVLQIFDSWAGALDADAMVRWSLEPCRRIVERIKARHPEVPVIVFPRGAGVLYEQFAENVGADALGLDSMTPIAWARAALSSRVALQGNLDPHVLVAGGNAMESAVSTILETMTGRPFVFNLGHGIVPETPPDNVAALVAQVRGERAG